MKGGILNRKNNFDAIRLLAALMVILAHSFPLSGRSYDEEPFHMLTKTNDFGHLGVTIFLFISGFLISNSLGKKKPNFLTYFTSRILRIIPALLVIVFLSVFISIK